MSDSFYSEFYVVEKAVELVVRLKTGSQVRIRIDALHDFFSSDARPYSTKAYIEEHVTLQPTYPANNDGPTSKPEDHRIWVDYDLPWTSRESADDAIRQAMAFLSERCVEE